MFERSPSYIFAKIVSGIVLFEHEFPVVTGSVRSSIFPRPSTTFERLNVDASFSVVLITGPVEIRYQEDISALLRFAKHRPYGALLLGHSL